MISQRNNKAYKAVADIFEWILGYTMKHNPNKY